MAQLYTTGPAHFYTGPITAPAYLGTCEESPEIDLIAIERDVQNSLGGVGVPFDKAYQGEMGMITCVLNRYNEAVYQTLATRPRTFQGGTPGTNTAGDIGSLMLQEGLAFSTWILFTFGANGYAPKPAMNGPNGIVPGYRFFATMLLGPNRQRNMGTTPKKLVLTIGALRVFNPALQTFSLYDWNVAGLPPIN